MDTNILADMLVKENVDSFVKVNSNYYYVHWNELAKDPSKISRKLWIPTWNMSAFVLSSYWFFSRKMDSIGFHLIFLQAIAPLMGNIMVVVGLIEYAPTFISLMIATIINSIYAGLYGNNLYFKKYYSVYKKALSTNTEKTFIESKLRLNGGTRFIITLIIYLVFFLIFHNIFSASTTSVFDTANNTPQTPKRITELNKLKNHPDWQYIFNALTFSESLENNMKLVHWKNAQNLSHGYVQPLTSKYDHQGCRRYNIVWRSNNSKKVKLANICHAPLSNSVRE